MISPIASNPAHNPMFTHATILAAVTSSVLLPKATRGLNLLLPRCAKTNAMIAKIMGQTTQEAIERTSAAIAFPDVDTGAAVARVVARAEAGAGAVVGQVGSG